MSHPLSTECHASKSGAQRTKGNSTVSAELLWRSFENADLEVRKDGRTVYGLFAPFDTPADVADFNPKTRSIERYQEEFGTGAFTRSINSGRPIRAYAEHGHRFGRLPIGQVRNMEQQSVGLVGEVYVSETPDGEEALTLTRDGILGHFSIGFLPVKGKDEWSADRTHVRRSEVNLQEVSIVHAPAYAGAEIAGVRSQHLPTSITAFDPHSQELAEETPDPVSGLTPMQARARIAALNPRKYQ
ncbi:MAG: HK97 family phage prohead protease [Acidimicrobiia bacterium]|nr:HK97 family phage prohead protease [Acidimicrobiia bacterium]